MQKRSGYILFIGSVINIGLIHGMEESSLSCQKTVLKELDEFKKKLLQAKESDYQEGNKDYISRDLDKEEEEKVTGEEIGNFLRSGEETRDESSRFSIVEYSNLLANSSKSSFTLTPVENVKNDQNCLNTLKSELEKRVDSRIPYYEVTYPMSRLKSVKLREKNEFTQVQDIIENKLKMIKRPAFKVLSTWVLPEELKFEQYFPDKISIVICHGDSNWKIID